MLAFTIGWQEVLIIVLFLLGIIVIPLPGRWMRRAARSPMRWSEEFRAPLVESIHDVAEAFFCSYPRGEYTLVQRERFRLTFRRGRPLAEDDGQIVLSLRHEAEAPEDQPVVLRVLLQPQMDSLVVTMKHEVTPRRSLGAIARKRLAAHFRREVRDFQAYLRKNFGVPGEITAPRPVKRIDAVQRSE
jgi:hypothetical protein